MLTLLLQLAGNGTAVAALLAGIVQGEGLGVWRLPGRAPRRGGVDDAVEEGAGAAGCCRFFTGGDGVVASSGQGQRGVRLHKRPQKNIRHGRDDARNNMEGSRG